MPRTTTAKRATTDAGSERQASGSDPLGEEAIRVRAYEISRRDNPGSPEENWEQAIVELRAERQSAGW